jgi:exodeoxyribonuclease V beta subunit
LQGGPNALSAAMRERWRYVLIDEFQDTDETQWSIFRHAFLEGAQSSILYLVGDPKQSIYRFRGADVDTYLRACQEVIERGGQRVQLDRNYRATAALVQATNAIFDPSSETPIFTGSISYSPVTGGRTDRKLVDGDGRVCSPVQVLCVSAAGDAAWLSTLGHRIAREVRTVTDPSRPWRFDGRALECGDVFVLTRNAREGRTIGSALRAAGVPHAYFKQDGLFQTAEAKEVRTLLLAIERPNDRSCRLAAWLTPFFGLPLADIDRVRDLSNAHPMVAHLEQWRTLADERDFERLFEGILRDSGIVRREILFAEGERELTNYLHVFEQLLEMAHGSPVTLRDLANELSGLIDGSRLPLDIEGNVQRLSDGRSAVQIMTIHKSKGLEAPVVFVAGGFRHGRSDNVRVFHDQGRRLAWVGPLCDPEVEERAKVEEREEEQRLMYVALTRAKARLYLPCVLASHTDRARGEPKALRGPYDIINRRVWELVRYEEPTFWIEDLSVCDEPDDALAPVEDPERWRPPAELLREDDEHATMAGLRQSHAGPIVTSYTRMKGDHPAARPFLSRAAYEALGSVSETELRAARTSGIFLHELLERVPLASFASATAFDGWRLQPDVSALFDEAVTAHRIDGTQRQHAERLVWGAYTTPLRLPGGKRLASIGAARRVVREMGFVFSMKQRSGEGVESRVPQLVRGSLDLAFDEAGVVYFVDWKSDRLASYAPDSIHQHVSAFYAAQARLYAVAIAKLLAVRSAPEHEARFGGMFYCFLRGFDELGNGVWSARPPWDQVLAWEGTIGEP